MKPQNRPPFAKLAKKLSEPYPSPLLARKIHFKYRRIDKLVLMTTQIYLVRSLDTTNRRSKKKKWMKWHQMVYFQDAINVIEYEDIENSRSLPKTHPSRRILNKFEASQDT